MPPHVALLLWFVLLLALFLFDPAKEPKVSAALWVPLTWMFFMGSRQLTAWLGWSGTEGLNSMAQTLEEGNPTDRTVELALLFLALVILISRSFKWGGFLRQNWALTLYLLFALLSVVWSGFPFAAFKKWFRDLGTYVMVLVILTDPYPLKALGTFLRRFGYLLVPLSVVLIKYFPDLARQYDPWTGIQTFTGATTSKNMLGIVCLVCGTYFFWDTVVRWPDRRNKRQKRILLVNALLIGMVIWLLNICDSATSRTTLMIACMVILAAHSKLVQRHPRILTVGIPAVFLTYVFLFFGLGLSTEFAEAVGRTSLSGRDIIWQIVLSHQANPLVGAGYESFWLGPRLQAIWASGQGAINEAHNGYLEIYLNLGYIGAFLALLYVGAMYRNICKRFKPFSSMASFSLAIWTVFLFHNCTEADFRSGPMWFTFVFACWAVTAVGRQEASEAATLQDAGGVAQISPSLGKESEDVIAHLSPWAL